MVSVTNACLLLIGLFIVGDTGIGSVANRRSKVLCLRGTHQPEGLVCGERGTSLTAEICMCSSGRYMSTCVCYPVRKQQL
jgi:hypothetical protein